MVSENLQKALEQNRTNIKALLNALDADYEFPEEPEKQARMGTVFNPKGAAAAKDVDMTPEERAAWLFEENAKAIAAASEAAGAPAVKSPDVAESEGMAAVKDALSGDP
jgi:hypothetical protein